MFERIVAAIDNDPDRVSKVLDAVQQLAVKFGADVLVVHVRDVERPATTVAAGRPGALPPALHFETEEDAQALVDQAVARMKKAGITARGEIGPGAAGSTARELLDIAQAHNGSLIVVGDRGSRVTDVLLGGVAHRIVHLAECPVLLVR